MAAGHSIDPFPSDIDRDAFGNWLSGLVDGEGCFVLGWNEPSRDRTTRVPLARFSIQLRADDYRILEAIKSFWGCGTTHLRTKVSQRSPAYAYIVSSKSSLHNILVPHFEKYPLRAKKQRDFVIWKRAVALCCRINSHPKRKRRGSLSGWDRSWTAEAIAEFDYYWRTLRQQRQYQSPTPPLNPPPVPPKSLPLFDGPQMP